MQKSTVDLLNENPLVWSLKICFLKEHSEQFQHTLNCQEPRGIGLSSDPVDWIVKIHCEAEHIKGRLTTQR